MTRLLADPWTLSGSFPMTIWPHISNLEIASTLMIIISFCSMQHYIRFFNWNIQEVYELKINFVRNFKIESIIQTLLKKQIWKVISLPLQTIYSISRRFPVITHPDAMMSCIWGVLGVILTVISSKDMCSFWTWIRYVPVFIFSRWYIPSGPVVVCCLPSIKTFAPPTPLPW